MTYETDTTQNLPSPITSDIDDPFAAVLPVTDEALRDMKDERFKARMRSMPEETDHAEILIRAIRDQAVTPLPKDEKAALEHQAKMLDLAFRRLLADADTTYTGVRTPSLSLNMYAAAFQAQNQYRQTVKMLSALKSRGAYKKKGHKKQRVKCNEIPS